MSKKHRLAALLWLMAVVVVSACSGRTSSGAHGTAGELSFPPFPAGSLAAPPSRNTSAVPQLAVVEGDDWDSASAGVVEDGTAARLFKTGPEHSAWAIYRLPTQGLPLGDAQLDLTTGGEDVWLLRANYQTMSWDALGPYGSGAITLNLDQPEYYSASHSQFLAVLAYEADPGPIFEGVEYQILLPETQRHDLGPTGDGETVALVDRGGSPALLYYDAAAQHTMYAVASVPEPVSAADWNVTETELFPAATEPRYLTALYYGDRVVSAHYNDATDRTIIRREPNPGGLAAWTSVQLDVAGGPCDLAIIDGRLTVAVHRQDVLDVDSDGWLGMIIVGYPLDPEDVLGDWVLYKAGAADLNPARPRLAEVDGRPALCWLLDNAAGIRYSYATVARPEAQTDWLAHDLPISAGFDTLTLIEHNGLPLMTFSDGLDVRQLRALNATPDTAFEWENNDVIDLGRLHDELSMGPTLLRYQCELSGGSSELNLLRYQDNAFTFWPIITSAQGFRSLDAALVAGRPAVAFVREDAAGGTVSYARLAE